MFSKKNKTEQAPELAISADQDLIVHNMPKAAKLNGSYAVDIKSSAFSNGNNPISVASDREFGQKENNFKTIGLIIMISGVVVIGLLVYLSYRFIIAPTANNQDNQVPATENISPATNTPLLVPVEEATSTDLSAAPVTNVDSAVNIVTSTPELADSLSLLFLDSDNDGLNDNEENLLGTSPGSADSDNDSYSDTAELASFYNPIGEGKINLDANLLDYNNPNFNYNVLYPKTWTTQLLNEGATLIFTTLDNSLVQISVQENSEAMGILNWYGETFPDATVTYDQIKSADTWEGVMGENGLNYYLTDKKRANIFVISYIPAVESRIAYPNIFQLIINSMTIK